MERLERGFGIVWRTFNYGSNTDLAWGGHEVVLMTDGGIRIASRSVRTVLEDVIVDEFGGIVRLAGILTFATLSTPELNAARGTTQRRFEIVKQPDFDVSNIAMRTEDRTE